MLTEGEIVRYDRQLKLFGEEGQKKLKKARVCVAGLGGLGSVILTYLAMAGVGAIRIVDHGVVEASNLNRQFLYSDNDVGRKKVISAEERLRKLNPDIELEILSKTVDHGNVDALVDECDLIVDGATGERRWRQFTMTTIPELLASRTDKPLIMVKAKTAVKSWLNRWV